MDIILSAGDFSLSISISAMLAVVLLARLMK